MSLSEDTLLGLNTAEAEAFLLGAYLDRLPAGRHRARRLTSMLQNLTSKHYGSASGALSSLTGPAPPVAQLVDKLARRAREEVLPTHDALAFRQLQSVVKQSVSEGENGVWLERVERENRVRRAQLEAVLLKAKGEGAKEATRVALKDLGVFFKETGDGANATRVLFQCKEFCTTQATSLEITLLIVEACIESGNFAYASTNALKAEQLAAATASTNSSSSSKIKLALALCDLDRKRYKQCAKTLLSLAHGENTPLPNFSYEDVAQTAVVCALASFSRQELQQHVVDNASFKPVLELVPASKQLVLDFLHGQYRSFSHALLHGAYWLLRADALLAPHADHLVRQCFVQSVVQFASPYSCVKLGNMTSKFGLMNTQAQVEQELAQLVAAGPLASFRIDSQKQLLVRRSEDEAQHAVRSALKASHVVCSQTKAMLFRASLLEQGVVYSSPSSSSSSSTTGEDDAFRRRGGRPHQQQHRQRSPAPPQVVEASVFGEVGYSSDEGEEMLE